MQRIPAVHPHDAQGEISALFTQIEKSLGVVPNLMKTMAQSPATLSGYLALNADLSRGTLGARLREQIAIAVAEANACEYCLSAHAALGSKAGLSSDDVHRAAHGTASDARSAAALTFALVVLETRGGVRDEDLARARAAGLTDAAIVEIIGHVALNVLTNYFNRAAATQIDFPRVALHASAA